MTKQEPRELVAVDRAREKVKRLERELKAARRERNLAVARAKEAGHPAAEVYRRAGISASTHSRQAGDG